MSALAPTRSPVESDIRRSSRRGAMAGTALRRTAVTWATVAVLGQLMFAAYVAALYGRATLAGQFTGWNAVTPRAWVPGEPLGNGVFGVHMLFTVVIVLSGALQVLPWLRRVAPHVHRWNGRLFLSSAVLMSAGGLFMLATRGTIGGFPQKLATAINGVLIICLALLALRAALARRFDAHRRWALRLWLAVGGVWFFRIGLMAWLVANGGPAGFDPRSFSGPFLTFLAFAQFLLPLTVLQCYLAAQRARSAAPQWAMAGVLGLLTLLTAGGIVAATLLMWWPQLQASVSLTQG